MRLRSVLIYLVIFIVAGAFYYVYEIRIQGERERVKQAETAIYDIPVDQIKKVLYSRGHTEIEIVRDGNGWKLVRPLETPADTWNVDSLIREALEGRKNRVFDEPVKDLSEFGLDDPQMTLTFFGQDQNTPLAPGLAVGSANPDGRLYYARLGDSHDVFTVTIAFQGAIDKDLFSLRDKSLTLFPGEKIERVVLTRPDGVDIEVKRTGLRNWEIIKPEPGLADNDRMVEFIYQGLKSRVLDFVDASPSSLSDYGLSEPQLVIKLFDSDNDVEQLSLGRPVKSESGPDSEMDADNVVWGASTLHKDIARVAPAAVSALNLDAESLKDRHVVRVDRNEIWKMEILRGSSRWLASMEDDIEEWRIEFPADTGEEPDVAGKFLRDLLGLKFQGELPESEAESLKKTLENPELTVRLTGPDQKITRIVADLTPNNQGLVAMQTGDGPVILVDKNELLEVLPPSMGLPDDEKNTSS